MSLILANSFHRETWFYICLVNYKHINNILSIKYFRLLIVLYLTCMYPNNDDALIATENSNLRLTPDLWWSQIGDAHISFSLGSYNGVDVPSWVTIDSSSGVLNITAPEVTSNTNYYFYVNSYNNWINFWKYEEEIGPTVKKVTLGLVMIDTDGLASVPTLLMSIFSCYPPPFW